MNFTIESDVDLGGFIDFVVENFKNLFVENIDNRELIRWDNYLQTPNFQWRKRGKKPIIPSARQILLGGIETLSYGAENNVYIIEISNKDKVPNTDYRYETLFNLINYGNLDCAAYPIFEETKKKILNNFEEIYNAYIGR